MLRTYLTSMPTVREPRLHHTAPTGPQPGAIRVRGTLTGNAKKFITTDGRALVVVLIHQPGSDLPFEAREDHGTTAAGHICADSKAAHLRAGCAIEAWGGGFALNATRTALHLAAPVSIIKVIEDEDEHS